TTSQPDGKPTSRADSSASVRSSSTSTNRTSVKASGTISTLTWPSPTRAPRVSGAVRGAHERVGLDLGLAGDLGQLVVLRVAEAGQLAEPARQLHGVVLALAAE